MTTRPPVLRARFENEIVVDNFAGGGGASTGIEAAGRSQSRNIRDFSDMTVEETRGFLDAMDRAQRRALFCSACSNPLGHARGGLCGACAAERRTASRRVLG